MGLAFASIAGSVIGSSQASSAARRAANAQLAGSSQAILEQQRQFNITQESLRPFTQTGTDALNQQRILLGLGALPTDDQRFIAAAEQSGFGGFGGQFGGAVPPQAGTGLPPVGTVTDAGTITPAGLVTPTGGLQRLPTGEGGIPSQEDLSFQLEQQVGAAEGGQTLPAGAGSFGADIGISRAGGSADPGSQFTRASRQANLARDQLEQQQQGQFNLQLAQAREREAARTRLSPAEQQAEALAALNESPGQKFLRDRAQKNLLRNASAIGGLGGGNVRSALVQQGVGFAQQDLENQFARLGQLAGQGQAATTNVGQFGQAASGNIANLQLGQGQTRASGLQNQNAAFQQGLSGVFTGLGQSGIFDQSQPPNQFGAQNTTGFVSSSGFK